jgi:uncharacterized glyoxalase superfamily protein PhnB
MHTAEPRGAIVPALRYRDLPVAMDWLCKAFGFEPHLAVNGDDGAVLYAELAFGDGLIMLGAAAEASKGVMTQPADTGGAETQICYLIVGDARAHCARAKAAGAEIILDIDDEASDGRGYSCRDPEGHIWSFGTYDPWKRSAQREAQGRHADRRHRLRGRVALAAGLVVAMVGSAALAGWALDIAPPRFDLEPFAAPASLQKADAQLERALKEANEILARERHARETAERAARDMGARLAQERSAREAAERAAKAAGERIAASESGGILDEAREKSALEAQRRAAEEARERVALAERSAEAVRQQLAAERSAREAAERASLKVKEELDKERSAREAEEHEHKEAQERAAKEERARELRAAAARHRPVLRYRIVPARPSRQFLNWDVVIP